MYTDPIPASVLSPAELAMVLTVFPQCADPMGQSSCLMGEFVRIRDEWMTCVVDPNMGGTGSTGGSTNTGGVTYCPFGVT